MESGIQGGPIFEYKLPCFISCHDKSFFLSARYRIRACRVSSFNGHNLGTHASTRAAGWQKLFCLQLTNCLPIKQVSTVEV